MPLPNEQFLRRLAEITDPDFLCDFLDITSEDILERFEDIVESYLDELREEFDVDIEGEEEDQ
tara:strand:- start:1851 stop:2039 length:189 start_codon:yes stop_codon:yes gene_type:complete